MPRKGHVVKRDVLPDPIYESKLVTRAINQIMVDGRKGTAQSILYGAFERVRKQTNREPIEVFNEAINNITPVIETRSRRVGGQNYQVPMEVRPERRQTLGLRWLIQYARLRNEKTMEEKLAKEIADESAAVHKQEKTDATGKIITTYTTTKVKGRYSVIIIIKDNAYEYPNLVNIWIETKGASNSSEASLQNIISIGE